MIISSFAQFEKASRLGNIVPVYRELLADMETPVGVFRKLGAASPYSFLLESVEGGERLGRYSFMGVDPALVLRVQGNQQELIGSRHRVRIQPTPIETLREILSQYQAPPSDPNLPPFTGGAVGFMAYDTVRYYENIPDQQPDQLGLPDCVIMVAEHLVAFDHVKHRMVLIANVRVEEGSNLRLLYDAALEQLEGLRVRIQSSLPPKSQRTAPTAEPHGQGHPLGDTFNGIKLPISSNCTRPEFLEIVRRGKEYITAGDIFQFVPSQRFLAPITCDPFDVYRALRVVNPSPYMFYLNCGNEFQLAGSSPEMLVRLQDGVVTTRPIAGTRPRGATPDEDRQNELDLIEDQKEIAEHVMLVDLGRNDVGRVSKFGTVRVTDFMTIERYSHVMHIVSNVEGDLEEGRDALDVLAACFPAGTLTGAPKIRAMQIIDELEKSRRGPYGGTVLYFSFNGSMDSCITIRTAVITKGQVAVQAGGGVVADSIAENEYIETVNKAKGMLKAVELAEAGLD